MAYSTVLFPPIIPSVGEAFIYKENNNSIITIPISIKNSGIKDVFYWMQVSIKNAATNSSILKRKSYNSYYSTTGYNVFIPVKIENKKIIINTQINDSYIFSVSPESFYNIQLAFVEPATTGVLVKPTEGSSPVVLSSSQLKQSDAKISEWSTICSCYCSPNIELNLLDFDQNKVHNGLLSSLIGQLSNIGANDSLNSYSYTIKKDNIIIEQSETFYSSSYNNSNSIYCDINYSPEDLTEKEVVELSITIKTKNNCNKTFSGYSIVSTPEVIQTFPEGSSFLFYKDRENGAVNLSFHFSGVTNGNIYIQRNGNSLGWETIKTDTNCDITNDYIFIDNTIKSGIFYKYQVILENENVTYIGRFISSNIEENDAIIVLDYDFITRGNKQFKIKFNNEISSLKTNVAEAKIETIGSKYPFIRRNGNTKYKSFTLSGLISFLSDENYNFNNWKDNISYGNLMRASQNDIYKTYNNKYKDFNRKNLINDYNNVTYERDYREKVLDFLQDGTPKLFRSATEGNILVYLMNISLTPNKGLGRMIYSFSAEAQEIDNVNINTLKEYNIVSQEWSIIIPSNKEVNNS